MDEGSRPPGRWDSLTRELHQLREAAGTPSYDTLTRTLIAQRMADGGDEHSARIAKSSVHDTFRFGRSRINENLTKELVRVMGGDPRVVDAWVSACGAPRPSAGSQPVAPEVTPAPGEPVAPVSPVAPPRKSTLVLLVSCLILNLVGREFVDFFHLPFFLDMTGTAIAAIALGPWRGAAVGGLTNVVGTIGSGWVSLPFALVNITGALLWGYGARRWGLGRTLTRFFMLNVLTALACSVVAVPIILTLLEPDLRIGHDAITQVMEQSIDAFAVAVGFSNVLTSLGDKLISGFVALVVISALPVGWRDRSPLAFANAQQ